MKKVALAIAALGMAVAAFAAEKKVESSLKPGERTQAFQVVDVSGPKKGTQLCYV